MFQHSAGAAAVCASNSTPDTVSPEKELANYMNVQTRTSTNPLARMARAVLTWFDTGRASSFETPADHAAAERIDWVRTLPFILMHAACLFAFVVGVSPVALLVCVALYFI